MTIKTADIALGIACAGFMSFVFVAGVTMAAMHLLAAAHHCLEHVEQKWRGHK